MTPTLLSSLAALLFAAATVLAQAQSAPVDFLVEEQLASTGEAAVLVRFGDFPDLSGAAQLATKEEKARYVYDALRQNTRRHDPVMAALFQRGVRAERLWIANAVHVPRASAATVAMLRDMDGVAEIAAVQTWQIDALERQETAASAAKLEARGAIPTWGVRDIGADLVWELGIRGEGAVVAGGDTGYDWTHPALRGQYRGLVAADGDTAAVSHDYHWYDGVREAFPGTNDANPCGFGVEFPCDDGSHGTHTMGSMVGHDGEAHQVGVAPEASWIACRNMDRGNGTPTSYLNCFQFFLAPTDLDGENPRPEMAPDVIANSWYCPESEGCFPSTYASFDNAVAALRAAGVVVVASAGNFGGNGCNTITDIPARVPGVFVVGAHDSLGQIAPFSSRGSVADGDTVRPDLTMPGVRVRSSVPGGGYAVFNGTSMAGPHAAGVVALMVSANPALRGQVDTIESMLRRSARPTASPDDCGGPGGTSAAGESPNYTFGYGRGHALRAVELARAYGGVSDIAEAEALRFGVSPNPARGFVTLDLPEASAGSELLVTDLTGRTVLRRRLRSARETVVTSDWPAGVYVLTVVRAAGSASARLVVE